MWSRLASIAVSLVVLAGGFSTAYADPPASVTYSYDDAGRLRSATYSDGKVVHYQYDPAGNRTAVTNTPTAILSVASPLANVTEGGTLLFRVTRAGTNTQTSTVDCKPVDGTADSIGPIASWLDYSSARRFRNLRAGAVRPG
jgi:YD repeat-containing protein